MKVSACQDEKKKGDEVIFIPGTSHTMEEKVITL